MDPKRLKDGLDFAVVYELTQKEMEVLTPFLEGPYTTQQLADKLDTSKGSLHHIVKRMKLKNIIRLKDRDTSGSNIYELNQNIFN